MSYACLAHYILYRFLRQHMLLLGVFYSSDKPTVNMYLRPRIDELNRLFTEGGPKPAHAGFKLWFVCLCRHPC